MGAANIIEVIVKSVDDSAEGFGSVEDQASGLGKSISSGMVVAAAAIAGVAVAVDALGEQLFKAMDIEAANDKMAAQLGLMGPAAENYGRIAGELYSGAYGDGLDDVNDALVAVTQNMAGMTGMADEELKAVTATAMDFAAVFGSDVTEATRAAGIMLKNGLAANATEAFDILTIGFQNGANAGDDLLDTFDEYSPLFNRLGLSGQQALGMISQSMQAGARDSDFAADAIKEFSIRAIDGSKTTIDGFTALGLSADKMRATFAKGGPESAQALDVVFDRLRSMKDPAKQAEVAVQLFGTKAEDLRQTLLAMDPSTAVEGLGEVAGAAEHMSTTLADNAKTKLESFKRTMETNVSNFIGEQVLPQIVGLAEKAAPAFETFQQKAIDAFSWIAGKPEALGALAAVVGVVLVAAFVALGTAAWGAAAGVIAATWPILAIGAAIAGLAALLVYAWNNWDQFREVVTSVVNFITTNAAPAFETIKQAALSFYETALQPIISYIQANGEAFANLGKVLLVVAGVIVGVVIVAILALIAAGVAMTAAVLVIVAAVVALIAVLYNFVQVLWDVFNNVRDWAGGVVDVIENVIQVFWDLAKNVGSALADAGRWVWDLVQKVNNMANSVGDNIRRAADWFLGLPGRIAGAVGDLGGLLVNAGRSIIDGLIRGIENGLGALKSKLGQVSSLIPSWKGPRSKDEKLLQPTGGWIMDGLVKGIQNKVPTLKGVLGDVSAVVPGAVSPGQAGPAAVAAAGAQTVVNNYIQGSIRAERDLVRVIRDAVNDLSLRPQAPAPGG